VKQQEERIRQLEKELKAAKKELYTMKGGNASSNFMQQDNSGSWKNQTIPNSGSVDSLQMTLVKFD
jgi:hypothetical protein